MPPRDLFRSFLACLGQREYLGISINKASFGKFCDSLLEPNRYTRKLHPSEREEKVLAYANRASRRPFGEEEEAVEVSSLGMVRSLLTVGRSGASVLVFLHSIPEKRQAWRPSS
jgi:hypothetical protein